MAGSIVRQVKSDLSSYPVLRRKVQETLLVGQKKIEDAKVRTYWQTGKLVHEHILLNKDRADYGSTVIQKLSGDLGIGRNVIYRAVQFFRAFPIVATSPQLTWSHYVELSKVSDKKTRLLYASLAEKKGWDTRRLAGKIREEIRDLKALKSEKIPAPRLVPKLGELYTYRLVETEKVNGKAAAPLQIDLGFNNHYLLTERECRGFKAGEIVESLKDEEGNYSLKKSARKEASLFTYRADIERVVDGDTLIVVLDLGFRMAARHYLRLRSVDCAELSAVDGKRAKVFTEKSIKGAEYLLITSTRSDKYGRYLADLYVPSKTGEPAFLNQMLLDEGLAIHVR